MPEFTPDDLTPHRDITHAHFAPGDRIVVVQGAANGDLTGTPMTIVAPSWHTPTDEDGWRLRNPHGGAHSYVIAHPRYLIHLDRYCPDCTGFLRRLSDHLLPRLPTDRAVDGGWYTLTALDQLVHLDDTRRH